jgi:hypothetical protein
LLDGGVRGASRLEAGTRFRLFPKPAFVHPDRPPEIVHIATPPGLIGPGPSDDRLYVVNPVGKRRTYGINRGPFGTPFLDLPPWRGPILPPVQPGADGHFDHIPVGTQEFEEAHVFGTIRFVLAVWEGYFGRPISWHFARDFGQLEVVMLPALDNAIVGYGFMEVGSHVNDDGTVVPFALNFDVIAHELGHLIIYSTLGVPSPAGQRGEYFGFQESAADTAAMIAVLHFESVIEDLLEETRGNLYTFNELDRFAELSPTTQIRVASNSVKLSEFAAGWVDEHDLSQPLTGALFDIFVDIFQENLVERGLIAREVADLSDRIREHPEFGVTIQKAFDETYPQDPEGFRAALVQARDYTGMVLAETWSRLSPDFLSYESIAETVLAIDHALTRGRYREEIIESFAWREIGRIEVGPHLAGRGVATHTSSPRALVPEIRALLPALTYRERVLIRSGAW